MRTILCLIILATALSAQESFLDADFSFSFNPPEGMRPLNEAELRSFMKFPADIEFNPALPEESEIEVDHSYFWIDTTGQNREISLLVSFHPMGLPWVNPDDYAESMAKDAQLTIDIKEPMKPPHPGFYIEGTVQRPDGVEVRRRIAYFTLGRNQYALMSLSSLSSKWDDVLPGFITAVDSASFPPPAGAKGAGGAAGAAQGSNAPQRSQAGQPSSANKESWGTLEVTGSLVLAVLLMMGLFMGGKSSS
ncbi:MAG: hypothetical protein ACI9EF_003216 [Pseudohongiellaceae bacterium]|jgi:hypothetical protein